MLPFILLEFRQALFSAPVASHSMNIEKLVRISLNEYQWHVNVIAAFERCMSATAAAANAAGKQQVALGIAAIVWYYSAKHARRLNSYLTANCF